MQRVGVLLLSPGAQQVALVRACVRGEGQVSPASTAEGGWQVPAGTLPAGAPPNLDALDAIAIRMTGLSARDRLSADFLQDAGAGRASPVVYVAVNVPMNRPLQPGVAGAEAAWRPVAGLERLETRPGSELALVQRSLPNWLSRHSEVQQGVAGLDVTLADALRQDFGGWRGPRPREFLREHCSTSKLAEPCFEHARLVRGKKSGGLRVWAICMLPHVGLQVTPVAHRRTVDDAEQLASLHAVLLLEGALLDGTPETVVQQGSIGAPYCSVQRIGERPPLPEGTMFGDEGDEEEERARQLPGAQQLPAGLVFFSMPASRAAVAGPPEGLRAAATVQQGAAGGGGAGAAAAPDSSQAGEAQRAVVVGAEGGPAGASRKRPASPAAAEGEGGAVAAGGGGQQQGVAAAPAQLGAGQPAAAIPPPRSKKKLKGSAVQTTNKNPIQAVKEVCDAQRWPQPQYEVTYRDSPSEGIKGWVCVLRLPPAGIFDITSDPCPSIKLAKAAAAKSVMQVLLQRGLMV